MHAQRNAIRPGSDQRRRKTLVKLTDQALAASRQPARCYIDVRVRNAGVGRGARAKDSSMLVRGFDGSAVDEEYEQQRRNRARPGRPPT